MLYIPRITESISAPVAHAVCHARVRLIEMHQRVRQGRQQHLSGYCGRQTHRAFGALLRSSWTLVGANIFHYSSVPLCNMLLLVARDSLLNSWARHLDHAHVMCLALVLSCQYLHACMMCFSNSCILLKLLDKKRCYLAGMLVKCVTCVQVLNGGFLSQRKKDILGRNLFKMCTQIATKPLQIAEWLL